ncbi:MAG TPA: gephyrin-like molybdotransferase Glp [bacterium]|nr:gephyrin-like molybdotransferase Glp [bacterium]
MISVTDAKKEILKESRLLGNLRVPLAHALYRVLAQDLRAPVPLPPEDNSAMDGYALKAGDTFRATEGNPRCLRIAGIRRAGDAGRRPLRSGEAYRIMTGAAIPPGADAVVIQEMVEATECEVRIARPVPAGANIRRRGEELAKGDLVLPKGSQLHSRSLGLLANVGFPRVLIRRPPRVALIVTGDELVEPGRKLPSGKIYDSNGAMLEAALRELHLEPGLTRKVGDQEGRLTGALRTALERADVILLTGGVSVGDYDFSKSAFGRLGIRTVFWKVAQKPGKPLFFGKKGRTLVFGLPGNPVSAWVCFHEYVRPALLAMQGIPARDSVERALLEEPLQPSAKMTVFLRGRSRSHQGQSAVRPLSGQGSHMLKALAEANCLIQVPPREGPLEAGAEVEVHALEGRAG